MKNKKISLSDPALARLYKSNPNFDILHFDFLDKAKVSELKMDVPAAFLSVRIKEQNLSEKYENDFSVEDLKKIQRVLRISPDHEIAEKLIENGFDSANKIAGMPQRKFVRLFAPQIKSKENAIKIYQTAVHISEMTMQLYGNVKDIVASPYYNAANFKIHNADFDNYFKNIPNYQEIFGSLGYLQGNENQSIFSPAAYFLDLMRITDEYISDPNMRPVRTIPPFYTLEERRPDLFTMELNGENTTGEISYLALVNEILKKHIECNEGTNNAYKDVSVAAYPFRLPFNLPLAKIRSYLNRLEMPLDKVYESILPPENNNKALGAFDIALERMAVSYQEFKLISEENDSVDGLTAAYGYDILFQPSSFQASGNLISLKDQKAVEGVGTHFTTEIKVDDKISVAGEIRTVTAIVSDTRLTVDADWKETTGSVYRVDPLSVVDGHGVISYSPNITKVVGTNTDFTKQVQVGDMIMATELKRKVVAVISDTELTVDEAWPYRTFQIPYQIEKVQVEPFQGQGSVIVTKGHASVTGMNTRFDTELTVGDSIEIQHVAKKIISIESPVSLTVDSAWEWDLGAVYLVMPKPVVKNITAYLPHRGTGALEVRAGSNQVKGIGTCFKTEVTIGDQIACAHYVRTVVFIFSDTELTVSAEWDQIGSYASYEIFPAQGLDIVDNFISRTTLSRLELDDLFMQELSPAELEAHIATGFFINNTGEACPYLQTYFSNDPANPVQRIKGITLKRLDRLNRFIRLKKFTEWSFTDLNWILASFCQGESLEMNENFILYLSQIKTLQQSLDGIAIPALVAFWSDMKTTGKKNDEFPEDIFDTVFNDPLVLNGKNPYAEDIPFDPFQAPQQVWSIEEYEGSDGIIRERLMAALNLDSDNVVMLGKYVSALTGGTVGVLALTLSNLSWLYRISQWSARLDLSLEETLAFLCLLYYPEGRHLDPPVNSIPLSVETYFALKEVKTLTEDAGWNVYQLNYILKGETGPYYELPYVASDLPSLINELSVAAVPMQLKASDFVGESTAKEAADFIFTAMQARIITESGIFRQYEFGYADASVYFPVIAKEKKWFSGFYADSFSLFYTTITPAESEKVFDELVKKNILTFAADPAKAVLSGDYTDMTELDFLKPVFDADVAELRINEIGRLLVQCKNAIEHTLDVWSCTMEKQQTLLTTRLAVFIDSSVETVGALKEYAAVQCGLPSYLPAFLTRGGTVTSEVENFVKTLSRSSLLAYNLSLNEKEIKYITTARNLWHFNIAEAAGFSLHDILSLIDYHKLVTGWEDVNNEVVAYFELPDDEAGREAKINKLSLITGWDVAQIRVLIAWFWPDGGHQQRDYDTVAGVMRLQKAFNAAKKLGTDASALLAFSEIAHLDLAPSTVFSDINWNIYENVAAKAMNLAGSVFGPSVFQEVSQSIKENLSARTRDAFLPFALWKINAKNPCISTPSDLYNYLLIDVEMSGCAQTSKIAQAIASVQLYMQRCRMMLETGVRIIDVPKIWWDWMSSYRVWEVNRKIFLYPENYIEPTLRKKVTPAFRDFSDDLLQNELNKDTVQEPFQKYLQQIDRLGSLVHVAGYNATRCDAQTGEEKETLFLFARTNIQPYSFYMRKLDDYEDWGPWLDIDIAINASSITPVYGFDRIFIFWCEKNISQSSSVKGQDSATETLETVELKYSFYDGKKWVHPQVLTSGMPINAFPSNYNAIDNEEMKNLLNSRNASWNIPYVLAVGKGFTGKGKVCVSKDLQVINGVKTQFLYEVKAGDSIWCMGEKRKINSVVDNTTMLVSAPWSFTADDCNYKIISTDNSSQHTPFPGTGKSTVTAGLQNVSGRETKFTEELSYGDSITIGDESRMVMAVVSDTELLVDSIWQHNANGADFTIMLGTKSDEQLIVILGAGLQTAYSRDVIEPVKEANPTKNTFINERNALNANLYSSFNLAHSMKNAIDGYVTMGPVQAIDSNFIASKTNLVLADYKYTSEKNPQPYRGNLDRQQGIFSISPAANPLHDNYWGNNIAGTANNRGEQKISDSVHLLSFVNKEKSSFINVGNQPGWFLFDNSDEAFLVMDGDACNKLSDISLVQSMYNYKIVGSQAYAVHPARFEDLEFKFIRLTTCAMTTLIQKLFAGGIDNLLTLRSQEIPELPFSRFYFTVGKTPPKQVIAPCSERMDFSGAYGLYFWEIFFHAPFLIADRLNSKQRYEDAKSWLEYIFNPTVNEDDSVNPEPEKRYWRFLPFRTMNRETLREILTDPAQIRRYNYEPFDPDVIARYRPVAYAKAIVMKYIDNILDWGDFLFAQDTTEAINQATNLYLLALDLLGKRPEPVGEIPEPASKTFNDIRKQYEGGIPQFLIELENTPEVLSFGKCAVTFSQIPFNKINSYFNVPENTDFIAYWDRVEDRLFKIRHCQNIDGVSRQLALFAPPINPKSVIRAYAASGGGFGFMSSFSAPIPFYRFSYLVGKARNLTAQVIELGNSLLSVLEKKDAEALNLIGRQQKKLLLQMITGIKEMQIKIIDEQIASQQESLNSADKRYTYYNQLIAGGISQEEQSSMDAALAAMTLNLIGSVTKTAASIGYAVPQVGSPFAMTYGGQQLGSVLTAASSVFEIASAVSNYKAQQSLTMAGYDRRKKEWTLQRNLAQYDKKSIEALMRQSEIQKQTAQQEVAIHKLTSKNEEELEAYYKSKFTNKQLYQWMESRISAVYFQSYNLAYTMAKAAERAYQYQYNTDREFINYGYWDDANKGLLAGEQLLLSLEQMESETIMDAGDRLLEIEKNISLLQLNPKALLDLKTKGECIFELSEKLFDVDFPGHYSRKIKSISVFVPGWPVLYPNATLTQLSNQLILKSDKQGLDAVNYLLGGSVSQMPGSDVLRSNWAVNQQVAISKGINDTGLFELDFGDPRYLPFEETGAVSTWKFSISLPAILIDSDVISDIQFRLKYTAKDGGDKFREDVLALNAFKSFTGIGYWDFNQVFSDAWTAFMQDHSVSDTQTLDFVLPDFVPRHLTKAKLLGFYFKLDTDIDAEGSYIFFQIADNAGISVRLSSQNDCSYFFKADKKVEPEVNKVLGSRSIVFDLTQTPDGLKADDRYLNPDAIRSIQLLFYYTGEIIN